MMTLWLFQNKIQNLSKEVFSIPVPIFGIACRLLYWQHAVCNHLNIAWMIILYRFVFNGTHVLKASAHSFKQFTSRLLKSTFSLSLCTYITRMDVMLDFICMGPVDLPGARRKRQNTKWKITCPQWDSNPQPFDSKSDALPTELAGLGECYPFKSPYYIHVLPILMYTLL